MTIEVTLKLPENLIEQARQLGAATQRDLGTVLTDVLEMLWLTVDGVPEPETAQLIAELSDSEVLKLAEMKMDEVQNQRLGTLQAKGKAEGLSSAERYELLALLQIYQLGQLRKSEALAEAVQRGLREPLVR
jgi:Mn-dependent DtxR family transcriptional regulator